MGGHETPQRTGSNKRARQMKIMLDKLPASLQSEKDVLGRCIVAFSGVLEIEKIYLFGSHCRGGSQLGSDVDLCIVAQNVESQFKVAQALRKSTRGINRKPAFTLVPISVERLKEKQEKRDPFYRTILEEGVIIAHG